MITQSHLKQILDYNPETGDFTRKYATTRYPRGSAIGWVDRHGHRYIEADGVEYRASRLAALYMTGKLPKRALNHRDRNNSNDAWENLTAERLPLDADHLRRLLRYDPESGEFFWLKGGKGIRGGAGARAGCVGHQGYAYICIETRHYPAHRLA